MIIDVRSKESVYITINGVTYYIDDSTDEQIVELYKGEAMIKYVPDTYAEGGEVGSFSSVDSNTWTNESGRYTIKDFGEEYQAFDKEAGFDHPIASDEEFDSLVEKVFEYNSGSSYAEVKPFPFNEGDDYYTIEDSNGNDIVWSCWDCQSEELHADDSTYFTTVAEAKRYAKENNITIDRVFDYEGANN